MMMAIPEKTFSGRSTAQRAAQRVLGNPKAREGTDFHTEPRGGGKFVYRLIPHRDAGMGDKRKPEKVANGLTGIARQYV